jgi:hypothetical protein
VFVVLHTHTGATMNDGVTHHFPVVGITVAYCHFRLRCTGPDVSGGSCSCFHITGFELYGISV